MPALPQFDYIFAIGTIFAFLDAWNIGMLHSCLRNPVVFALIALNMD